MGITIVVPIRVLITEEYDMSTTKEQFACLKLRATMAQNRKVMRVLRNTLEAIDNSYANWVSEDFKHNTSPAAARNAQRWHKLAAELDRREREQQRHLNSMDIPANIWDGVLAV